MHEMPNPAENQPFIDPEQQMRAAREVGPVALWGMVTAPLRRVWERAQGHGRSGAEMPVSLEEQWAEDAAAQEGFQREDAPYMAYEQLRNRFRIPNTTDSPLPASAARDLAALERTEIREDRREGIAWRQQTDPLDLFTGSAMRAADTAAKLEAGVTPSQYQHMNRKEQRRLDRTVSQRARALHGAFIHDIELARAFDAYVSALVPHLSPARRREIEAKPRVLSWVEVERMQWWARDDSLVSEYKRAQ